MDNLLESILNNINLFDIFVILIFIYSIVQCFVKGFSLSLISFMKWVLSTIVTIILVPKLQPTVSEYIESEFINNVGLGIIIFVLTLFLTIVIGKALGKAVTWTGVGSIDKIFGMLFGIFKGYIVFVCIFTMVNWFYSNEKWDMSLDKSYFFPIVEKGNRFLIEEFPSRNDLDDTKKEIEKI